MSFWSSSKAFILDNFFKRIYSNLNPNNMIRINLEIKTQLEKLDNSIKDIVHNQKTKNILKLVHYFVKKFAQKIDIKKYLDNFISGIDIKKNINLHKNILVIGKSGVGKSTLINCFLNINEAPEGLGLGITKKFHSYLSNPDCYFRLTDSKGFEEKDNQDLKQIKNFINDKLSQDNDGFIHCIWYCIEGTRFCNEDKERIKQLLEMYEYDCLPIIVVYTNALDEEQGNEVINRLKLFLGNNENNIEYVQILSREKNLRIGICKSFGLDELKRKTLEKIGKATKSSYYQSIKRKFMDLYEQKIYKKYKKIKDIILAKVNLTQYHSIESLNFKLYFLDIFNLIFFNDDLEQNNEIENLLSEIRINKNDNNDDNIVNNLLLNNEMNIINEENNNLIEENEININNELMDYNDFLNQIKQSYIDEFNSNFFQKFENILNIFFPKITSQDVKQKLLQRIEKREIRNYTEVEKKLNISQESDKFIQTFFKESLNKNINDDNIIEEEEEDNDDNIQNQDNLSTINNLRMKSKVYKINNDSILAMEDIEHKLIIECIKFVSLYIMDTIKDYLLKDEKITNYLKNENNFITQIKNNLDNL